MEPIQPPPWVLTNADLKEADLKLRHIIGCRGADIPKEMLNRRLGHKDHDGLVYCGTFFRWCMYNHTHMPIVSALINLFEHVDCLRSRQIDENEYKGEWMPKLGLLMARREGLLPPSEATFAIHSIMHNYVELLGPEAYNNNYKYERANMELRRNLHNRNHPVASMVKNYLITEAGLDDFCDSMDMWKTAYQDLQ